MACTTGNCHVTTDLWAGGRAGSSRVDIGDLDMQDSAHPNVAPFSGTLLLLGEPSDQPPHGSDGHLIQMEKDVAESRLNTLPGMGINYQSDFTGHDPAKKVGVITEASISGNKVKVKGLIWKKDFPEAVRAFKANNGRLGMSMELGDVYVRDKDERVWHLEDFHFTGATVLLKNHAAYEGTDLAASRYFVKALAAARDAREIFGKGGNPEMGKDDKEKVAAQSNGEKLTAAISAAVEGAFTKVMTDFAKTQAESTGKFATALESISASQQELVKGLQELAVNTIAASGDDDDEVVDEVHADATDATMAMAKHDATEDATDATDVEAGIDPTNYSSEEQGEEATPGDLNPDAESHAKSQARSGAGDRATKAGGKSVDKGIAAGRSVVKSIAAAKVIRNLKLENSSLRKSNETLNRKVGAIQASLDRYADRVERKSIAPEVSALLEKNGYDVRELMGTKQRLSVSDVDQILANAGVQLEPTVRASIKNQLLAAGMMDQGQVNRYN